MFQVGCQRYHFLQYIPPQQTARANGEGGKERDDLANQESVAHRVATCKSWRKVQANLPERANGN